MLDTADIEKECLAQIDRMTRAGLPPTHFDSRRHIHTHPAVYPAVLRAVRARRIPHLRVPCEPLDRNVGVFGATVKKSLLLLSARRSRRVRLGETGSDRPGLNTTGFVGISLQGESFGERLFELIRELPDGTTELMTHPGYNDATLVKRDNYTVGRETELRVLCSQEFRTLLGSCHVTLTNFGDQTTIVRGGPELAEYH